MGSPRVSLPEKCSSIFFISVDEKYYMLLTQDPVKAEDVNIELDSETPAEEEEVGYYFKFVRKYSVFVATLNIQKPQAFV